MQCKGNSACLLVGKLVDGLLYQWSVGPFVCGKAHCCQEQRRLHDQAEMFQGYYIAQGKRQLCSNIIQLLVLLTGHDHIFLGDDCLW